MIFISFIEEYWPGQRENTTMGRIEVYTYGEYNGEYADEEIRWATDKVEKFRDFREHWDFQEITEYHLNWLRKFVKNTYT